MLKNIWSQISFFCTDHKKPIPMYVRESNGRQYYACSHELRKDGEHPFGFDPAKDESPCWQKLPFQTAEKIVERISTLIEEDMQNGTITDYTGYRFKVRNVEVTVIKQTSTEIKIGVKDQFIK